MTDNKGYELCHFHSPKFSPTERGWIYLEWGHNDARCTGGTWYYKGDKALALVELAKRKKQQAKDADEYYARPWV